MSDQLRDWYGRMWLIRLFEERAMELFKRGLIRGSVHPCIGMEGGAVGTCAALDPRDLVCTYHRGHGHCLAKGLDPTRMMAELLGRASGYCGGKGGTMHIASFEDGVVGADGVVGGLLPVAVGAAYVSRLRPGPARVVVAFFGEGAVNQGVFHESMNLAAVFGAPVIFVCENNQWALNTRSADLTASASIAELGGRYGMPSEAVDATDVELVNGAATAAVARARAGEGPSLIELQTYRWTPHSGYATGDPRPAEEIEEWRARDPIARLGARLAGDGLATARELDALREEAGRTVAQAAEAALELPPPDRATALDDGYASPPTGRVAAGRARGED